MEKTQGRGERAVRAHARKGRRGRREGEKERKKFVNIMARRFAQKRCSSGDTTVSAYIYTICIRVYTHTHTYTHIYA